MILPRRRAMMSPRRRAIVIAVKDFLREQDGPTAVEYAVMLALIVVACVGSIATLTNATAGSFNNTASAISGAFN